MKRSILVLLTVALIFVAGCAKNTDVAALVSEIATLNAAQSKATAAYAKQIEAMQSQINAIHQELDALKASDRARSKAISDMGEKEDAANRTFARILTEHMTRLREAERTLDRLPLLTDEQKDDRSNVMALLKDSLRFETEIVALKERTLGSHEDLAGLPLNRPLNEQINDLEKLTVGEGALTSPNAMAIAERKGTLELRISKLETSVDSLYHVLKIMPPP